MPRWAARVISAARPVAQAGGGVPAAWQDDGVVVCQIGRVRVADWGHGDAGFGNQRIELIQVAGIGISRQRQVDLARHGTGAVVKRVFFRQPVRHHGHNGHRRDASTRLKPIHGIAE